VFFHSWKNFPGNNEKRQVNRAVFYIINRYTVKRHKNKKRDIFRKRRGRGEVPVRLFTGSGSGCPFPREIWALKGLSREGKGREKQENTAGNMFPAVFFRKWG